MTKQADVRNDPKYIPLYDLGFVGLVDKMGDDSAIVQAARTSYGKGTTTHSEDRNLIRYLMRKHHCYHPNMQVLTIEGWKEWKDCGETETFLIPDPTNRRFYKETLKVLKFVAKENMHCFKNNRLSFCVTSNHKMWFKGKYSKEFSKIAVQEMSPWGHFDPLQGYIYADPDKETCPWFEFLGFYLGDGSYQCKNRISFHLKKKRKIKYLMRLLKETGLNYTKKEVAGVATFSVETPHLFLDKWIIKEHRAKNKEFLLPNIDLLDRKEIRGLWTGLAQSDGHYSFQRPQLTFSSTSTQLLKLFETLSILLGFDAHKTYENVTAYFGSRTSLESRKQYYSRKKFKGTVYCATSSTGFLAVRGSSSDFGFVCGNSTPFEMAEVKLHIKLPIFVMRQLVRHRTASLNEYSGRYSEMTDEFYIPALADIKPQSKSNKQGRENEALDPALTGWIKEILSNTSDASYHIYQALLGNAIFSPYSVVNERSDTRVVEYLKHFPNFKGIARELARIILPLNTHTECYWKIDLHNLFHFLGLRMDEHAQEEIRIYASAVFDLISPHYPEAFNAWIDYQAKARNFSRMEIDSLLGVLHSSPEVLEKLVEVVQNNIELSKREKAEFTEFLRTDPHQYQIHANLSDLEGR